VQEECKNFCKCGGELKFINILFNISWFEFIFNCYKCGDTVIHSRYPTLQGYQTVHVTYMSEHE
jgi:hypothetical protein